MSYVVCCMLRGMLYSHTYYLSLIFIFSIPTLTKRVNHILWMYFVGVLWQYFVGVLLGVFSRCFVGVFCGCFVAVFCGCISLISFYIATDHQI